MKTTLRQYSGLVLVGWMGLVSSAPAAPRASEFQPPVNIPPAAQILATLRKEHPRLLAHADEFARLRQRVAAEPQLGQWLEAIRRQGERILKEAPSRYEIPDGLRLLGTSRRVLGRVQTLGLLYRLDGDRRWADRAWTELEAAAQFKDWNPRHFLDTAEMTHAFALGYDWFYEAWTDAQRATLRQAMVEKGLKLALQVLEENRGWAAARHNWNQVCNGGISMGALALAEVEPDLAGRCLHLALRSLQRPMLEFAPDGAWAEGPGYWNYATTYNVVILAALQTALGTDFGLPNIAGFAEAGMFPIYATGPLDRTFNYADAHEGTIRAPHLFWLARQFNRPLYAWYQRQHAAPHPLDLLWFDPRGEQPAAGTLPLDKYFRHAEVVTLRSGWAERDALFVGFKAGDNKANHSHLDLGSFVLDARGVRWALDLGSDDYNLPGYFGKQRWTYYRLRAEGHNTLVLNPGQEPDQDPAAATRVTRFESKPDRAFAVADLTPAYAKHARRVERGVALLNRRQVLVQDELQADAPADVWWFLHTGAKAQVGADGTTATLTQGSARLEARILAPANARFEVRPPTPLPGAPKPEKQADNRGVRKLAIHLPAARDLRLAVLLTPLRENESPKETSRPVQSLRDW
jgi:hypothetical protein